MVSRLKELIQSKQAIDSIKDVGAHTLELWKMSAINKLLLCKVTLLFSAQEHNLCWATGKSHWTYWASGTWFLKICSQIRLFKNSLQYLSNTACQRSHPHNCKGPAPTFAHSEVKKRDLISWGCMHPWKNSKSRPNGCTIPHLILSVGCHLCLSKILISIIHFFRV